MLNIAYNTTRLQRIIDDYEDKKSYRELRKAKNRGKAATDSEITEAVELFLSGDSIAAIAKGLYRSAGFVRGIIERVGVPQKTEAKIDFLPDECCVGVPQKTEDKVDFLPDECCAEQFDEGEIVWAARYSAPAIVRHEVSVDYQAERAGYSDVNYEKKYGSKCYSIYVMEKIRQDQEMYIEAMTGGFNAFCLAYDLGKLTHLKKYGVDLSRI